MAFLIVLCVIITVLLNLFVIIMMPVLRLPAFRLNPHYYLVQLILFGTHDTYIINPELNYREK